MASDLSGLRFVREPRPQYYQGCEKQGLACAEGGIGLSASAAPPSGPGSALRNDRQHDEAGMVRRVINGLNRLDKIDGRDRASGLAAVGVPVVPRKVRARHVETDAMPSLEHLTGRRQSDHVALDLAGCHGLRCLHAVTKPRPYDPVNDAHRPTVGPDVDELGGEIGVGHRGGCRQRDSHVTGDLDILGQHLGS